FPKDLRGLLTQLYSHGVLSSLLEMSPIRLEDNNWASLAKIPFHTASENLPKIQFEEFVYSEWRVISLDNSRLHPLLERTLQHLFAQQQRDRLRHAHRRKLARLEAVRHIVSDLGEGVPGHGRHGHILARLQPGGFQFLMDKPGTLRREEGSRPARWHDNGFPLEVGRGFQRGVRRDQHL